MFCILPYRYFVFKEHFAERFWFELRTENEGKILSYRHSFLMEQNWKKIFIPFSKLQLVSKTSVKIDLSKINALFFTVNNVLSYDEKGGTLELKDIGLY